MLRILQGNIRERRMKVDWVGEWMGAYTIGGGREDNEIVNG